MRSRDTFSSRLRRADDVAAGLASGFVRVVGGLIVAAIVLYATLWALNLLSFGSQLEDFDIHPNISVTEPGGCKPGEATRYEQIGGREFYVTPAGGC